MTQRTALIAGASGLVGGHVLRMLLEEGRYVAVHALLRRPLPVSHPKLTQHILDLARLDEWSALAHADDVFCCLGTTIKVAGSQEAFRKVDHDLPLALGRCAIRCGASSMLIVTAMGADASSKIFYNRVKGEVEAGLKNLSLPSLHILRPSLLLGDRTESRIGERIGSVAMALLRPVMVGPMRPYRAIQAHDVAKALIHIAGMPSTGPRTYDSAQIQSIADAAREVPQ